MAEPALNPTSLDSNQLVSFHMNQIRELVVELHKQVHHVPEVSYEMDIAWHPASKLVAQEVIIACRAERISATYEPPRKDGNQKYIIRLNLQRIVCSAK